MWGFGVLGFRDFFGGFFEQHLNGLCRSQNNRKYFYAPILTCPYSFSDANEFVCEFSDCFFLYTK